MSALVVGLIPVCLLAIVSLLGFVGCVAQGDLYLMDLQPSDDQSKTGFSIPSVMNTHRSKCAWITEGESITLRWDTKVRFADKKGRQLRVTVNGQDVPDGYLDADISNLRNLKLDGENAPVEVASPGLGVLRICSGGRPSDDTACVSPLTDPCQELAPTCAEGRNHEPYFFPFYSNACTIAPSRNTIPKGQNAASLRIESHLVQMTAELSVPPTIFTVPPSMPNAPARTRTIWRRATPVMPSDTPGFLQWQFQEQGDPWDDNFSTSLAVVSVQAISNSTHLNFDKLIIMDPTNDTCHPDSRDPTRVSAEKCQPIQDALGRAVTLTPANYFRPAASYLPPASANATQGQVGLGWSLYFNPADNPGLDGKSDISVGFTLQSMMPPPPPPGGLTAGDTPPWPVLNPANYDFGPIVAPPLGQGLIGPSVTQAGALRLSAERSNQNWTVLGAHFSGDDPTYFSAQFRDPSGTALTLPFTLGAGQSVDIDLTYDPSGGSNPGLPLEHKDAVLRVPVQNPSNIVANLGVRLSASPQLPPGVDVQHPCPPHICKRPPVPPHPPSGPR